MKINKKILIISGIIILGIYLFPWIHSTFFKDVEYTTPVYNGKTRQVIE